MHRATARRRLAAARVGHLATVTPDGQPHVEDWSALWWVRVDGSGRVIDDGDGRKRAFDYLAAKYRQYQETPPPGPFLAIDIESWRTWP